MPRSTLMEIVLEPKYGYYADCDNAVMANYDEKLFGNLIVCTAG